MFLFKKKLVFIYFNKILFVPLSSYRCVWYARENYIYIFSKKPSTQNYFPPHPGYVDVRTSSDVTSTRLNARPY